jgi:hypothetical protein
MTMKRIAPLLVCLAATAAAADVPSGWKVVKDKANRCEMAVPQDWTSDPLVASFVTSPDKKTSAVVHGLDPKRGDYKTTVDLAKQMYKLTKVVEDSASRTMFTYAQQNGKPGEGLWIATSGPQVCTATVDYADTSFAADARKIGASVGPAK